MTSSLSSGMIEVRYILLKDAGDNDYAMLLPQLPREERENAERYLHLRDRLAFAAARVLVRKMLSLFAEEPAEGWRFIQNDYGKPAIVRSADTPDLQFNISHCVGMVAVAVSLGHPVGIDVEFIHDASTDHLALARSYFSATENQLIESQAAPRHRELFYELWTLKEAYLKAQGHGLSEGLSNFSFDLDPPAISFSPESSEKPSDWFFQQDKPDPSHQMAVAVRRRRPDETLTCRIIEVSLADLL